MEFPLNIRKIFNLIPNPQNNYGDTFKNIGNSSSKNSLQYVQAHKGAQVWIPDTTVNRLAVEYESSQGRASAGLRVQLGLDPDRHYQVRIKAYLIRGDRAFIYCEDENDQRLIPRSHWITQETRNQTFILEFTANTPRTWLGILFYDGDTSYSLFIEDFTVLEIPERSENAPQGPVLTHLLPSSLHHQLFKRPYDFADPGAKTSAKTGADTGAKTPAETPAETGAKTVTETGATTAEMGAKIPKAFQSESVVVAVDAAVPAEDSASDQTLRSLNRIRAKNQVVRSINPSALRADLQAQSQAQSQVQSQVQPQALLMLSGAYPLVVSLALTSLQAINQNRSALEQLSARGKSTGYRSRTILHIPYAVEDIPTWLIHLPDLELNRCPDYGALTSLLGLVPILDTPPAGTWILASLQTERIPVSFVSLGTNHYHYQLRSSLPRYQNGIISNWNSDSLERTVLLPVAFLQDDLYEISQDNLLSHYDNMDLLASYLIFSGYKIPAHPSDRESMRTVRKVLTGKNIWCEKKKLRENKESVDIDRALPPPSSLRADTFSRTRKVVPKRIKIKATNRPRHRVSKGRKRLGTKSARRTKAAKARIKIHNSPHTSEEQSLASTHQVTDTDPGMAAPSSIVRSIGPGSSRGSSGRTIRTIGSGGGGVHNPLVLPFERHGTRNGNSGRVAVIVEPRADPLLILILGHFLTRLDRSWTIQLFHGSRNKQMIMESSRLRSFIRSGELLLVDMGVENLTRREYSQLLLSKKFYHQCEGELILIFQMDSYLCDNPKRKLADYYQYDYVGAPWKVVQRSLLNQGSGRRLSVGNGGLSLRRKTKMLQVCDLVKQRRFRHLLNENEDKVISSFLHSSLMRTPVKLPSVREATLFSSETIYTRGAIGGHRPWSYHGPNVIESLSRECAFFKPLFEGRYF